MCADLLQSLDLQSVANAHLCASLLRIKAIAESPKLPDEVKNGVPKPEITEEERAALHNVTSGLYNQTKVRDAVDKAITDFCRTLKVPVPDKKGKPKKGEKTVKETSREDPEDQSEDRAKPPQLKSEKKKLRQEIEDDKGIPSKAGQNEDEEWNGFSDAEEDNDEEGEGAEERAVSHFDDRLGGSDSEDSNGDDDYDTANEELDPMEITDESASDQSDAEISLGDDVSDEEDISGTDESEEDSEEDEDEDDSDSDASAISPPTKTRKEPKHPAAAKATETKFLPSLMGGYVSGSESDASDVDVAPAARKNRRGQRARQAIWEKKFKEKAKHLEKQASSSSGRDAGWDLKRGAVEGGSGSSRTPWKQGIKTPFEKKTAANPHHHHEEAGAGETQPRPQQQQQRNRKLPTKKDDEGPLHPSWEARKKAKEAQQTAAFQGKRVVFD